MSSHYRKALAPLIGSALIASAATWGAAPAPARPAPAPSTAAADKGKTLMAEATSAITETQSALKALDSGKSKEAIAALERATGKLDVILARDPKLALAPAGTSVVTEDFQGGLDAVKQARKKAEDLIHDGQFQRARVLMKNLASETVVNVINIPLATYPMAIKQAVALIDQNKTEDAKRVLQDALNTEVIQQTIIALPLVHAQGALASAEILAEKKDRTTEENTRLSSALDEARSQLTRAEAFGYGTKTDFDQFNSEIAKIRQETAGNQSGKGFFDKIKSSLSSLVKSG